MRMPVKSLVRKLGREKMRLNRRRVSLTHFRERSVRLKVNRAVSIVIMIE